MKIDGGLTGLTSPGDDGGLEAIAESARRLEEAGYAGAWTAETSRDPFLPHVVAAEHTSRIELGTSIAVAFARNPMLLANLGHDLQRYSDGRFVMGLGTQIKPHITKRFSMEWSRPAARMREMISAMRAIWTTWNDGEKLAFRGDFYTHTLMTPFFDPGPNACGPPKVFIAAVGPLMSEVAGEVCDGLICHAFSTERYLREVTIPAVERGLEKSGRTMDDFEIVGPGFVVTGATEEGMVRTATGIRQQIAFYGSTPAYRPVLDLHGWGDLQDDLNRMSKQGEWQAMGELIDDEVLSTFAVVGEQDRIAPGFLDRYGDCVDRLSFYGTAGEGADFWEPIIADLSAA
ncbi:MAG: LLM class F420-dependent oxidoreductase [Actinomycetota bacterium]|nr:LLM class F420-dependent oxidoreductase [Actinomycetota bacterium]MEE2958475.1 LLM class F420-dependent oxidoreductase [Actinomycetota bacterium]